MRFILLTIVLALGVAQVVYADTIAGEQTGGEVLEKDINTSKPAINMIADIAWPIGVILLFVSFWLMFSGRGRGNPDIKKNGHN